MPSLHVVFACMFLLIELSRTTWYNDHCGVINSHDMTSRLSLQSTVSAAVPSTADAHSLPAPAGLSLLKITHHINHLQGGGLQGLW